MAKLLFCTRINVIGCNRILDVRLIATFPPLTSLMVTFFSLRYGWLSISDEYFLLKLNRFSSASLYVPVNVSSITSFLIKAMESSSKHSFNGKILDVDDMNSKIERQPLLKTLPMSKKPAIFVMLVKLNTANTTAATSMMTRVDCLIKDKNFLLLTFSDEE